MVEDFIAPTAGNGSDRVVLSKRWVVKLLIIGQPNDVEVTSALLYPCGFCRVEDWSRPLQFTQIQEAAARQPSEIMRIYKRYLRQVTNFSLKVSGIVTCLFLH